MEEAVVGAVVGATFQVVLQNLISFSKEKIDLILDFKDDLEKLKDRLIMIQNILYDAKMQQVTSRAAKLWMDKLEDVAFEADNALDEFNYQLLREDRNSMEIPSTITVMGKAMSMLSIFSDPRRELGHKVRDINEKLDSINQEASNFGLQMKLVGAHAPGAAGSDVYAGSETNSLTADPIFLGRDNDVSRIVEMLTTIPTEQEFSILPIVGMGGLGKTTLIREVLKNEKIKIHFADHIWVHVSRNSDPVSLLKKILTTLTLEDVTVGSNEVIVKKLQKAWQAKTYLLVLDDAWSQNRKKWEDFMNSLSGITSVKGNGIIVTTRSTKVASVVQTLPIYKLKHLSEDSCWSIIKAKALGEGHIPQNQLENIGRNIAKRCQGLPLAANIVGGVLQQKSEDEWRSIDKNWLSDLEGDENDISKILKLSFEELSSPSLKKCFAYCSIFPKGACIDKEELVELWMAEGFLQNDQGNDMEIVGNKFFNLLLQNSLLQVVERDDPADITCCSMHSLVHDVACSVLGSSRANDNISDGIYKVRYIGHNYVGGELSPIPHEQAKCLRTLFFKGEISDTMFCNFNSLHVLTLMDNNLTELPSSVSELIHLRYLDISYTNIRCLPDSIGGLYHLQTLRSYKGHYHYRRSLRKLPSTLKYLTNLRHLHIHFEVELPPELGRLTSLQTLPYFKVEDKEGHRIVELGSLKNLKGKLEISNLENVHEKEEAKSAYLYQKPNLLDLTFRWSESRECETNDDDVLEDLQPHPNLKSLKIYGFRGTNFPLWTLKMAVQEEVTGRWVGLNKLAELKLEDCTECEEIPTLGHLPNLKSLRLRNLTKVRSIGPSFYGIDSCTSNNGVINVFPALERLELRDMSNLKEWVQVEFPSTTEDQPGEVKVFPCLEYLSVHCCHQLMSAPNHFPFLKELHIYKMDSGLPLANICGIKLTSLTKLRTEGLDELERFPYWLFYNNRNLSKLEIISCPKLGELPDGLHNLNSLEELFIVECPNLKSIPYSSGEQSQGLTSLRSLVINECKGLINLPCEMVESCALSLRELEIVNVPKFIISSSVDFVSLHSLKVLILDPPSDLSDFISFKETFDGIFQGCQSLGELKLMGMGHWDSLPNSLRHLSALSFLWIDNFGMEEFPEWFGNLSSLKEIYLCDCKKLRRLPPVFAMLRLTKLALLDIRRCPLLCVEKLSDGDSEWAKISHIPNIWVDSGPIKSRSLKVFVRQAISHGIF